MSPDNQLGRVKVAVRADVPVRIGGIAHSSTFTCFDGLVTDDFAVEFFVRDGDKGSHLVRLHSECVTGDTFNSMRCDCGSQLDYAIAMIAAKGGCIIYLRQEGRGIGLNAKLQAYNLQDTGDDTYSANRRLGYVDDARDYAAAAAMLRALGYEHLQLLSNNPKKADQLRLYGIDVTEVIPMPPFVTAHNERYLRTKAEIGGHSFSICKQKPPINE